MALFGLMFVAFFALVGAAIYFLPTIVAVARDKRSKLGIFVLNFFLGWSLVGWVVALVWAISEEADPILVQSFHPGYMPMPPQQPAQPQQGVYLPPETLPPAVTPPRDGV